MHCTEPFKQEEKLQLNLEHNCSDMSIPSINQPIDMTFDIDNK